MARATLRGNINNTDGFQDAILETGGEATKRNSLDARKVALENAKLSKKTAEQIANINKKNADKIAKEKRKADLLSMAEQRKAAKEQAMTVSEALKKQTAALKESTLEAFEDAWAGADTLKDKLSAVFKQGSKYLVTSLLDGAANVASNIGSALSSVASGAENYFSVYAQYMSGVEARIQGAYSDMSYESLTDTIRQNTAGSPYVKLTDVLENLATLVDSGTTVNLTQRAFLATVSDKIATTFDAFDANLLRLVRIQRSDSTAARLGMEAELTKLFNHYFDDTSYLSQAFDSVSSAMIDLTSQLSSTVAVEFEYQVQKWLGSLGAVGVDEGTLSSIASAINALGSGDVDYLTGNTSMQNLLVMAANRAGLSYSDMLINGINSSDVNALLASVIQYIQDVTAGQNNVVKSQYAELFGLTMADIAAFENISDSVIEELYGSAMAYNDTLTALDQQLGQIGNRMHLSEMYDNVIDNLMAATGIGVASNAVSYATYKIAGLVEDLTGGIYIPTISVMGNSIDIKQSIEGMVQSGVVGISLIGSLLGAVGNWVSGNTLDLAAWEGELSKGSYTGFTSTDQLSTSKSATGTVSNTSSKGLQQSLYDEQQQSAEEVSGTESGDGSETAELLKKIKERTDSMDSNIQELGDLVVQLVGVFVGTNIAPMPVRIVSNYINGIGTGNVASSDNSIVSGVPEESMDPLERLNSKLKDILDRLQNTPAGTVGDPVVTTTSGLPWTPNNGRGEL